MKRTIEITNKGISSSFEALGQKIERHITWKRYIGQAVVCGVIGFGAAKIMEAGMMRRVNALINKK